MLRVGGTSYACRPTKPAGRWLFDLALPVVKSGIVSDFLKSLKTSEIEYEVFSGVQPNPTTDELDQALEVLKQHHCTAIIGVGGGSPIDVAKGVAAIATNPGSILDYEGIGRLPNPALPLFAVPTASGTGSEARTDGSECADRTIVV